MSLEVRNGWVRRTNATIPFARLQVSPSGVWLGTRTRTIPKDRRAVQYDKADISEVFSLRGFTARGLGIATRDGKTHYFGTFRKNRVLKGFTECGYEIGPSRRANGVVLDQFPLWWKKADR
jgi:hypothetical protein